LKPIAAPPVSTLTEFHSAASDIAGKINVTSQRIAQLIRLVKTTSMFNNPEGEINRLVHKVREDITTLNQQVTSLMSKKSSFFIE